MRRSLKERQNTLPLSRSGLHSAASDMAELGPEAAAKLHSRAFAEALKERNAAPKDEARGTSADRAEEVEQATKLDLVGVRPTQHVAHAAGNERGGTDQRFVGRRGEIALRRGQRAWKGTREPGKR
jgi:hypothetical protein